jgi:hypothetical protein
MADTPETPAAADADLDSLVAALRATYPRGAHRGRLDQISQLAASLKGLIGELPAEEEREAEYEARLLALHDQARFTPHEHPSSAHERLQDALSRRKAA